MYTFCPQVVMTAYEVILFGHCIVEVFVQLEEMYWQIVMQI